MYGQQLGVRVNLLQRLLGGQSLGLAHVDLVEQKLPVQVAHVHGVQINL